MYSFASGTIVSARTSSPSMPGTQPVSSNISLAVSRRALTSLGVALLMIGFLVLVHVRQMLLDDAIARGDAVRVINFFRGFLQEEAAAGHHGQARQGTSLSWTAARGASPVRRELLAGGGAVRSRRDVGPGAHRLGGQAGGSGDGSSLAREEARANED